MSSPGFHKAGTASLSGSRSFDPFALKLFIRVMSFFVCDSFGQSLKANPRFANSMEFKSLMACLVEHLRKYEAHTQITTCLEPSFVNLSRWNDVPRTSTTFWSQIATFSQFQVYLNVTQAEQMINRLLLNHFHSVISSPNEFKRKRKRRMYCIRFGHSLWSADQLPAQEFKTVLSLYFCGKFIARGT